MKKIVFSILAALIILSIFYFTDFPAGILNNSRMMYVSVRHSVKDNIHSFDWYVENRSKKDSDILAFKNGNIINYEIRNTVKAKYTKLGSDSSTVVLKRGEQFNTTISLTSLEKGHYTAKFWAEAEESNKGTMVISFDVK